MQQIFLGNLSNSELVEKSKYLCDESRKMEIEILLHLVEIKKRKLWAQMGFGSFVDFAEEVLGMTEDMAWKRSQAAKVAADFPAVMEMLRDEKTHLSQLAMLASRITSENSAKILEFLPGRSRRELAGFLETIDEHGNTKERVRMVKLEYLVDEETAILMDQAIALALQGKAQSSQNEALRGIVEVYLNARHPLRKAQRAEVRQAKKETSNLDISNIKSHPNCLGAGKVSRKRPAIPAHLKHYIFHRDKGQCTYMTQNGKKCAENKFLEIDHIKPWAIGGKHEATNLRLLCRTHNQLRLLG